MSEDFNLIAPIFGCDISDQRIRNAFDLLPPDEKECIKRVTWRSWLTLTMRYQSRYAGFVNLDEQTRLNYGEIPAQEIYLLFTCIDTLAQPEHEEFWDWLRKQVQPRTFTWVEIERYWKEYKNDHGVKRNLTRFFDGLPRCVKRWLEVNMKFGKVDKTQKRFGSSKHILDYFYDYRNGYTHQSDIRGIPSVAYIEITRAWSKVDTWKNLNVYCRDGIDLATVLRVTIWAAVLQQLGVQVSPTSIKKYLIGLSRQSALYGFLIEVEYNRAALRWWENYQKDAIFGWMSFPGRSFYAFGDPIPELSTFWCNRLLNHISSANEGEFYGQVGNYQGAVGWLNSRIRDFNSRHTPSDNPDYREGLESFLREETHRGPFNIAYYPPPKLETNGSLLARYPC